MPIYCYNSTMRILDYKKIEKKLYQPKTVPSIIDVPEMVFIAVDGRGNPNENVDYTNAIEILYGLSYAIKMNNKSIQEYVVPPLEGFWQVDDDFRGGGAPIVDKNKFIWRMLIRQPEFVTKEIFEAAKVMLSKKKPLLDLSKAQLTKINEGLSVQVMHIGSYDDEPATIMAIEKYAIENGYLININETRHHHEIYLSDPRKVEASKMKTIIRHPIVKK